MACNHMIAFSLILLVYCTGLSALDFEYPHYTGSYSNGNVTFSRLIYILDANNATNISLELSGTNSQYFVASKQDNDRIVVTLSRPVPDIEFMDYLIFALSATQGTVTARTVIHVPLKASATGNCYVEGFENDEITINVVDTDRGSSLRRRQSNIYRITNVKSVDYNLNNPPYITASINDSHFLVDLMTKFKDYEVNETSQVMAYEISLECRIGFRKIKMVVNIRDTNNYAPVFLPSNNYNYTIITPIPKGFPISYSSEIIVRDNDLTNYEIVAQIQDNNYFNVSYVDVDKTGKNYKLVLTAKTDLTMLPNPISVIIFATDKDLTGYPALTSFAQITVQDRSFSSLGPKFEYDMNYGIFDNEVNFVRFDHDLTVIEGHTPNMQYWLEGTFSEYFSQQETGNVVTLYTNNNTFPESIILNTERLVFLLYAENEIGQKTSTTLNIVLVQTPNCELVNYNDTVWSQGINVTISDTFVGDSIRINTRRVIAVEDYVIDPPVIILPHYIHPVLYSDRVDFEVDPNLFPIYEKHEFAEEFTLKVTLKCRRNRRILSVTHKIIDSNNHSPTFVPPDSITEYQYNIYTPVPAGFYINKLYYALAFRDVDLTNYRMSAIISDDSSFNVTYAGVDEIYKKEHRFDLVTTRQIDSIPSTISFNITVTDMDRTGDPRRSVTGRITVCSRKNESLPSNSCY